MTLSAALQYASMGIRVLPVAHAGKFPMTWHGVSDATTDEAQIREWWAKLPDPGVAIACGRAAYTWFWVLDIDGDKGMASWQRAMRGRPVPATPVARTGGGGYHYYWRGRAPGNKVGAMPGVDTRSQGGYVVAPPSMHSSGHRYRWIHDIETTPLSEPPAWLMAAIYPPVPRPKSRGGPRPGEDPAAVSAHLDARIGAIPEGRRNDTLFRLACAKISRGLTAGQIRQEITEINSRVCDPPLGDREVDAILRSIERYQPDAEAP